MFFHSCFFPFFLTLCQQWRSMFYSSRSYPFLTLSFQWTPYKSSFNYNGHSNHHSKFSFFKPPYTHDHNRILPAPISSLNSRGPSSYLPLEVSNPMGLQLNFRPAPSSICPQVRNLGITLAPHSLSSTFNCY